MTRYVDAESIRKVPFRSVLVEVDVNFLADMLGHRFKDSNGDTISMESVDIWVDDSMGAAMGMPILLKTPRPQPICSGDDCSYCRQ